MGRRGILIGASAAAVALLVFLLIALLPGGGDEGGPGPIADAAEKTAQVEGLRFVERGTLHDPDLGRVPFVASGESDMRGRRSKLHADYGAIYDAARRLGGGKELGDREDWQMDFVLDRRTVYMRYPALIRDLPGGKSWVKADIGLAARAKGIDQSLVDVGLGSDDPTQLLRFMRAVSDEVEELGTETIRGAKTTRYAATIELRRYPELVPEAERADARRSIDAMVKNYGTDEIHTEVWIGEDGFVRRVKQREFNDLDGSNMTVHDTTDFYDHGKPVSIAPPDADHVFDANGQIREAIENGTMPE